MKNFHLILLVLSTLFGKDIIAVLDLEQIGLTPQEAKILTQRLTTKLISIDKYQVVERTNMDKILKEQKFQNSGCTDSECAVEIGQLLNTDFIVIGSVSKFGSMYSLDSRLIDVAKGKGLISAEFSKIGEIEVLMSDGITSIANQLCNMGVTNQRINQTELLDKTHPVLAPKNYEQELKQLNDWLYGAGLILALTLIEYNGKYVFPRHHNTTTNSDMDAYAPHDNSYQDFSGYTYIELQDAINNNPHDWDYDTMNKAQMVLDDFEHITIDDNPILLGGGLLVSAGLVRHHYNKKKNLQMKYNISLKSDFYHNNLLLHVSYNF